MNRAKIILGIVFMALGVYLVLIGCHFDFKSWTISDLLLIIFGFDLSVAGSILFNKN